MLANTLILIHGLCLYKLYYVFKFDSLKLVLPNI